MSASKIRFLLLSLLSLPLASAFDSVFAQGNGNGNGQKLQVGYVVVTPTSTNTTGLAAFETFGEMRFGGFVQAGVLPSELATRAMLFVTTNSTLSRNLGIAIANPQPKAANVTFTLRDGSGSQVGTPQMVTIDPGHQTAQFITQLFAGQLPAAGEFDGTLTAESDQAVAMIGLRFRGMNFSTIPVTVLVGSSSTPDLIGPGGLILPQFADGGGWASEIVLSNTGTQPLTVDVRIFDQQGNPLTVTLNGITASSQSGLTIPAGGVIILAPRNNATDDDGM